MCEEASCANRSPFDLVCLQDIRNPGANRRGIKDAMNGFDRDFAAFADRLGEWCGESIITVHKFRAVIVPSNSIIIAHTFVGVRTVLRNNSCLVGGGEGREI